MGKSVRQTKVRIREVEASTAPSSPPFSLGGGSFLSSVVAGFSHREGKAYTAPSSPDFVSGGWRLPKLCAAGLEPVIVLGF